MKQYTYSWTRHYGADAQSIGDWIQGQRIKTAEALVDSARDPLSPAHQLFDWDDSTAAAEYRLLQARIIKQSLRVEIIDSKGKPQRVVAFIGASDRGSYVHTLEASDDELTEAEQVCWRQMQSFRDRFKRLQFAHLVVQSINQVDQSVSRRKKKPG